MDWYYIKQGYALITTTGQETGHWFGGEPYHSGAKCPVCKIPLLLLADIDCKQIRKTNDAKLFHSLDRLPLYYCWRCSAEHLTYIIVEPKRIKVLRNEGRKNPQDFPYENYPTAFPKRPVSLVPIEYSLAKILAVYQEVDSDWLTEEDQEFVKKGIAGLRHSGFSLSDVNRHQLGGIVRLIQDHHSVGCPNPKCRRHKLFKDGDAVYMKELAVLFNDPLSGLPMVESLQSLENPSHWNEWVQVVYWICEECLAIAASNRCD